MFEGIERLDTPATVFFADDSSVARRQIENTLDRLGANYYSAKNGEEAWEKLQEIAARADASHTPISEIINAIITDVEMPGMDGYVLTKHIKSDARFKGVPVLMHSSLSADANMLLGSKVGADAYIAKFDPVELSNALIPFLSKNITD